MDYQHGMVGGGFPMGAAAGLYILFGLAVIAVIVWLQRQKGSEGERHE
ncbi:MAG: hypothetical protein HUU35_18735 [Armatimonadetes bacterium]|nr:hypothetical protein [Armatimonadota bacterium]